jgi:hypothetical protein
MGAFGGVKLHPRGYPLDREGEKWHLGRMRVDVLS